MEARPVTQKGTLFERKNAIDDTAGVGRQSPQPPKIDIPTEADRTAETTALKARVTITEVDS